MVFSSVIFLFFFLPITVTIALFLRNRKIARNVFLLLVSLLFYYWGEKIYTLLMISVIVANYYIGILLNKSQKSRKPLIVTAVVLNLVPLAFFKYANFFMDNVNAVVSFFGFAPFKVAQIHLPIGISFFTFQIMSYIIDLYWGKADVQKNAVSLGLYISLFPQLIAGPIVRYLDLAKQLVERKTTLEGFAYGVRRFIIGLGKKVLIANVVAMPADKIFAIPAHDLPYDVAWIGIFCYTLQLYFDFSGYSDMAIGIGKMFGFTIPENFNYPYIVRSFREFWQRWHISLTSWFRDYVYFPLGGSRVSERRGYFNLIFVFVLTGLWHGAAWNFIVWGLIHGVILVLERVSNRFTEKLWKPAGHVFFIFIFELQLVFFRAESLPYALTYIGSMFGFSGAASSQYSAVLFLNREVVIALIMGIIGSIPFIPLIRKKFELAMNAGEGPAQQAYATIFSTAMIIGLTAILMLSCMSLASDTYNPFIYFRF